MKVIAFSCVHWMTRELQMNVYEYDPPLDYAPFLALCNIIFDDPPDVIINLGDFTETAWRDNCPLPEPWKEITDICHIMKLAGNHDHNDGEQTATIDGVRYEHGHKLVPNMPGADASVDDYVARLRENTAGERLVHGHSHMPAGPWPLDVGSVTFSRTYGEIIDGEAKILNLSGEKKNY